MKIKIGLWFVGLCFFVCDVCIGQDIPFSQYQHAYYNTNICLPASSDYFKAIASYRNQPIGVGQKITSAAFSLSYPLLSKENRRYGGLGFAFLNTSAAQFIKTSGLFLSGAYNFELGKSNLSVGGEVGYAQLKFDPSGQITANQLSNGVLNGAISDETFATDTRPYVLVSPAIYWYAESGGESKYFVGLQASNINNPKVTLLTNGNEIPLTITTIAGVQLFKTGSVSVFPNVRHTMRDGIQLLNVGSWLNYKTLTNDKITLGLYYNTNKTSNISIELNRKDFFINFGYNAPIADDSKYWQGNVFEIHIGLKKLVRRKTMKDMDKDGVVDELDICPETPGLKDLHGCPDKDGDGVPDNEDQCVDLPGTVELKGCPDSDGDGVLDKDDECIEIPGRKELKGCPDLDGDGVPDKDDECPNQFGSKLNHGCPFPQRDENDRENRPVPIRPGEASKIKVAGIVFEFRKSTLKSSSVGYLRTVGNQLSANPNARIVIEGHTDSIGRDQVNDPLSVERATFVKKFLISHGISADRIQVVGFGSKRPVDTNSTPLGRSKNRRVEIFIVE